MESAIRAVLQNEVDRRISEFENYHNYVNSLHIRDKKFCGKTTSKVIKRPTYWEIDKRLNPYHIRKNFDAVVHSLSNKIRTKTYAPNAPHMYKVRKGEKERSTAIFQIPDEAISKYLYTRLLQKNKHRFSSLSYAYRNDRNVHFAIQDIAYELKNMQRVFVAEFDFKDFFGTINHEYLLSILSDGYFNITEEELMLIKVFLPEGGKGIYLGTSISLFLANAVCQSLDRNLENIGLRFARYADDTVIWSDNYGKICQSFVAISAFSKLSGVKINELKSEGISLLQSRSMNSEFGAAKAYVNFCGYRIQGDKVSIKDDSVNRIKENIAKLINKYLLKPVRPPRPASILIPTKMYDYSYLSTILQIRRYIYGQLNDRILINYLRGTYSRIRIKGLMSFYPLVDDEVQLIELDSWLHNALFNAIQLRSNLFKAIGSSVIQVFPYYCAREDFTIMSKKFLYNNNAGLFRIPSFLRIHKAIQKGVELVGIESMMNPKSNTYNYKILKITVP